jgi:predicted GIY-YIG superfamily endonuclease
MVFHVYMIRSGGKMYVGASTDTTRRLRQHNGELAGGASYTRGASDWRYEAIVSGFRTWREALQFEWALKQGIRKARGTRGKTEALRSLLARDRWTVNSPLADEVPLTVELTLTQASRKPTR